MTATGSGGDPVAVSPIAAGSAGPHILNQPRPKVPLLPAAVVRNPAEIIHS
jgi:hypothetical protein